MKELIKQALAVDAAAVLLGAAGLTMAKTIKFGMSAPQGDNPEWNALKRCTAAPLFPEGSTECC